jgi:hypothetical protein
MRYCRLSSGSDCDATPPETMILMWSAPLRSSSRVARITSGTPSATRAVQARPLQHAQANAPSVRMRWSPCPPVWLSGWPAMNSRGPRKCPCSTAAFIPQSAPPVSRSVVNPRRSIAAIATDPFAASSVSGTSDSSRTFTSVSTMWMCASISPGISVRPPRSTRRALSDAIGRSDTSRTVSPSTSTSMPSISSSRRGSRNLPP